MASGVTTPLKAARTARGWSQSRVAWELKRLAELKGLRVSSDASLKTQLSRWENGHVTPEYYRPLLCELFGATSAELGFDGSDSGKPGQVAIRGARTTEDVVDVLSRVQKLHRGTVQPEIMQHLQDNLRNTVTQYESLDHSILAQALLKQRLQTEALLDECSHSTQRRQLFEIAGAASGVLGYIAVGRSDFSLARAYCLEAFQLGDSAGNTNLQAWARGFQSFCEYYAGRYDDALALAKDGLNYAQSGPQSVRLTINGAARAMGKLGDTEGVHRATDEAYELMSRNDVPGGVPSSIAFGCYSAAQTASNAATAYVSLAIPEKAQYYVDLALPEISKSNSPWSRSLVMIDLAVSLIRAKEADLDHATNLVLDALAISADRPIISVQQRTSEFVRDVRGRWGYVPQVRMVIDAMPAVTVPQTQGE